MHIISGLVSFRGLSNFSSCGDRYLNCKPKSYHNQDSVDAQFLEILHVISRAARLDPAMRKNRLTKDNDQQSFCEVTSTRVPHSMLPR